MASLFFGKGWPLFCEASADGALSAVSGDGGLNRIPNAVLVMDVPSISMIRSPVLRLCPAEEPTA